MFEPWGISLVGDLKSYKASGALLLLTIMIISACVRVISIDYLPANPYKGQGTISIGPFEYSGSQDGARRIESNPQGVGRFYMSMEVAKFFAGAVASELNLSGYAVASTADLNISGVIERFYYDSVDAKYASLELIVRYIVRLYDKETYAQLVRVFHRMPKSELAINGLIRDATQESIHQFLHDAREANVLALSNP